MAALVFCEDGLVYALDALTTAFNADGVVCRLFQNNHTPVEGDDISDYTEADFSGYAPVTIGPWDAAAIVSGKAEADATTPCAFANTTGAVGNDIYGYYVTDSGGTFLIYAQAASSPPIDMNTAGQSLTVTPRITDDNA